MTWSDDASILKVDEDTHTVWGWASVSTVGGQPVEDLQGDQVDTADVQKAAHDFMTHHRVGGEMHSTLGIGTVVESIVFTKALQNALGIDLGREGWFIGVKVHNERVWKRVKAGELLAFSIGGTGQREDVEVGKVWSAQARAAAIAARRAHEAGKGGQEDYKAKLARLEANAKTAGVSHSDIAHIKRETKSWAMADKDARSQGEAGLDFHDVHEDVLREIRPTGTYAHEHDHLEALARHVWNKHASAAGQVEDVGKTWSDAARAAAAAHRKAAASHQNAAELTRRADRAPGDERGNAAGENAAEALAVAGRHTDNALEASGDHAAAAPHNAKIRDLVERADNATTGGQASRLHRAIARRHEAAAKAHEDDAAAHVRARTLSSKAHRLSKTADDSMTHRAAAAAHKAAEQAHRALGNGTEASDHAEEYRRHMNHYRSALHFETHA